MSALGGHLAAQPPKLKLGHLFALASLAILAVAPGPARPLPATVPKACTQQPALKEAVSRSQLGADNVITFLRWENGLSFYRYVRSSTPFYAVTFCGFFAPRQSRSPFPRGFDLGLTFSGDESFPVQVGSKAIATVPMNGTPVHYEFVVRREVPAGEFRPLFPNLPGRVLELDTKADGKSGPTKAWWSTDMRYAVRVVGVGVDTRLANMRK
jgi:hypothetical protein